LLHEIGIVVAAFGAREIVLVTTVATVATVVLEVEYSYFEDYCRFVAECLAVPHGAPST